MLILAMGKIAGALGVMCFTGVAVGVGLIFASLVYSVSRNPSMKNEATR